MEAKKFNTLYDFELYDGEVVQMTLSYYALFLLGSKNKAAYDKYNRIMRVGPQTELENVSVLYTAYLCANLDNLEGCMSEQEFLRRMPDNREQAGEALTVLLNNKKKK